MTGQWSPEWRVLAFCATRRSRHRVLLVFSGDFLPLGAAGDVAETQTPTADDDPARPSPQRS